MDMNILNTNISDNNSDIIQTKTIKPNSKYDHQKKIDLVKKINKIKKKEYLINIFKIITLNSKDFTENTNGVFIFFHNLNDETYEKIENYVNMIFKIHKKNSSLENIINSELSDTMNNYSETYMSDIIEDSSVADKDLSNKEKMIMRRKKYEEYLYQNQSLI